ncbi:3355_t:CDS:2 [Acaulospora colombiana]|uniref:3355_t:CDS:1 n=1 Tax=Acaulospora colombiana TaxID=27376 RepID=A0ACA9NHV2_9GLOM|nr:3355_t:CDS:2 [Acaulospora colombiana]
MYDQKSTEGINLFIALFIEFDPPYLETCYISGSTQLLLAKKVVVSDSTHHAYSTTQRRFIKLSGPHLFAISFESRRRMPRDETSETLKDSHVPFDQENETEYKLKRRYE